MADTIRNWKKMCLKQPNVVIQISELPLNAPNPNPQILHNVKNAEVNKE